MAAVAAVLGPPSGEVVEAEESPAWAIRHAALQAVVGSFSTHGMGSTVRAGTDT